MVLGALVLLSACGDEPKGPPVPEPTAKNPVNTRTIARAIESRLEDGAPLQVKVTCPADVNWRPGKTFTCLVKNPSGKSQATVTLGESLSGVGGPSSGSGRLDQGEYTWTWKR